MKLQIVIPIGVAAPGTPVQKYFEYGVNSLLAQEYVDVWIAADENVPDRIKEYIIEKNLNVKWFTEFSYFRKGGIWKKIFDTWKETDTPYVAFMHYDDIWEADKAKIQINHIIDEKLNGSWSEVYIINSDGQKMSDDLSSFNTLNINNIGQRTIAFAHACILKRESLMNCGILDLEEEWSAQFEDIWALYMHKIGNMKKTNGAKMCWRDHNMSISQTAREESEYVIAQRKETEYSVEETFADANKIKDTLLSVYQEIKINYENI